MPIQWVSLQQVNHVLLIEAGEDDAAGQILLATNPSKRIKFSPSILPAYLRKTKNIERLILRLYLKGISKRIIHLHRPERLAEVIKGVKFVNGIVENRIAA